MIARWTLYENLPDVADEPAIFQLVGDRLPEGKSAFDVADRGGAIDYPPRSWWGAARRRARRTKEDAAPTEPPLPKRAWAKRLSKPTRQRGESKEDSFARARRRLFRADPLPGESRDRAKARVAEVRRYFGQLGSHRQAVTRAERAGQWRVTVTARAVGVLDPGRGEQDLGSGVQTSPWQPLAKGEHSPTAVAIRALYLDTVRAATRTSTDQHGPGAQLSTIIPQGLDYEVVNIIPDRVELHFQP